MLKYYYIYEDDGPNRICGQSMSSTRPFKDLMVSDRYISGNIFKDFLSIGHGRSNPRITYMFSSEEGNVYDVPDAVVELQAEWEAAMREEDSGDN